MKTNIQFLQADLHFLKECKRNAVYPKFIELGISCKVKNNRTSRMLKVAKTKWLQLKIKNCYKKLNKIEFETYYLHLKLTKEYTPHEWMFFDSKVYAVNEHKLEIKKQRQQKKLCDLLSGKNHLLDVNRNNFCGDEHHVESVPPKFVLN
jgi:hypothetical protein